MGRLLTLRRNLSRLLTRNEVDDNFVNVATDFSGAEDPALLEDAHVLPFMSWADTGTGWLRRRNVSNDSWINEHRLHRASLGIFSADQVPTEDVGPICIVGKGYAEWDSASDSYQSHSSRPVGTPDWWPLRASIPIGQISLDGQTVSRATFPDLANLVSAGLLPVVSEAEWLADPSKRGSYSVGDGVSTIRLPDLNGKSSGSLGAVVRRGDGDLSAGRDGLIQRDALQNITGSTASIFRAGVVGNSGALGAAQVTATPGQPGTIGAVPGDSVRITFDASLAARTATETRALNVTGVWTVHAFGTVANPGSVEAAQLANDLAALGAAFQSLWDCTSLNLGNTGRFITGNFDGAHHADTASVRSRRSESVTYLPIVPPAGGNSAHVITRDGADANSRFAAFGFNGGLNFAEITFSRHGAAPIPEGLRFVSASIECGRVLTDGTWIMGSYDHIPNVWARAHVNYIGGWTQYGMVFRPQSFADGVALQFQAYNGAVAGYIQSNANLSTIYATTSDYRSKTVLGPLERSAALESVLRLRPITFRMNGVAVVTRPLEGFVAHELQALIPQAVTGQKDETRVDGEGKEVPVLQGVDLSKIVPTLVAAMQQQQWLIEQLTRRLDNIDSDRAGMSQG